MYDLSSFFDLAPDLFCVLDTREERFIDVNLAWIELMETTKEDLTSRPYWEFMETGEEERTKDFLSSLSSDDSREFVNRYRSKSGKIYYLKWLKSIPVDNDPNIKYVIATDVTEVLDLKSKVEILDSILESSFAGYWDKNLLDETESYSPSFKRMLGYSDDDTSFPEPPDSWKKLLIEEDKKVARGKFEEHVLSRGKTPFSLELRYRHRTGRTLHVLSRGRVVNWGHDGAPLRIVGSYIDVTETTESKERIEKLMEQVRERKEELSTLLSILYHDLRAPLSHILGFVQLLKTSPSIEHTLMLMERARKATTHSLSILEGVRTLSEVTIAQNFETIDLNSLVVEILDNLLVSSERKRVKVEVEELPVIRGNLFCVRHAISNVISNSIKFSSREKSPLIRIENYCDRGVVVRDNGIGVRECELKTIFRMFKRLSSDFPGTGSGLGIVSKVMDLHNGHVWAEQAETRGLCVYLDFNNV